MDIYQIAWLVILVIFLAVELATSGLTTIWFAIGAALAFLSSLLKASFSLQIIIFVLSSIGLFIGFFPFVKKRLQARTYNTNADILVGKEAVLNEDIRFNKLGTLKIGALVWSATSINNEDIPAGTRVVIKEISGNKLIVSKAEND